jgi:hypothetical protein
LNRRAGAVRPIDDARAAGLPRAEAIVRGCVDGLRAVPDDSSASPPWAGARRRLSRAWARRPSDPSPSSSSAAPFRHALLTLIVLPVMYDLAFRMGALGKRAGGLFGPRAG